MAFNATAAEESDDKAMFSPSVDKEEMSFPIVSGSSMPVIPWKKEDLTN